MNFSKKILVHILFTFTAFVCHAQKTTYLNDYKIPIKDTSKFEPCYFSIETVEGNTTLTKIVGMDKLMVTKTILVKDQENKNIHKTTMEYGDNQTLKSRTVEDFITGVKLTETYYENGQIETKEQLKGENIQHGEYFNLDGSPRTKKIRVNSEPKGGLDGWFNYLSKALVFPKEARKLGIDGVVYVAFEVTPEGKIENIGVMNPEQTHESLVNEAMRVVWKYPYLWTPEKVDGKYVRTVVRVPINFRLG
jgi:TonB family protein